ncbi:MAG: hypothetical protein Q8Q33_01815 [Chlamydiota bacterium]|nr:hypothetical protein [Chlamydiota bacterium]
MNISIQRKYLIALSVVLLFIVLLITHLHGYSISRWRAFIDNSEAEEVILGEIRSVRSDDYLVGIPLILAQRVHQPAFPVINTLIGNGQNMLMNQVPIQHWISIFRPHIWGFFIGSDFGLAWNWWLNILGLFLSFFFVFNIISRNDIFLSAFASLALLFTPFMQFWSLNCAPICTFMALCFISLVRMFSSKSKAEIWIFSLLLAWSGAGFILQLYPPYQITLAYLFLFMSFGYFLREKNYLTLKDNVFHKSLGLTLAFSLTIIIAVIFYLQSKEVFDIMLNTDYPGKRSEIGGGYGLWRLLSSPFVPWLDVRNWHAFFGNICEASSFIFFFPMTCILVLWSALRFERLLIRFHS